MNAAHGAYEAQKINWNGVAGRGWVEAQALLDRIFKPLENLLVEAVVGRAATHVLDVGCGTGGVTLAVARALGAEGHAVGVDVSAPMIAAATGRAAQARAERVIAPVRFVRADAATYAFERARFDMILSRFGVMFFEDVVGAFANLRHAAREDAALRFIVWRSPEENPFMTTAERAAAPLLPALPARNPNAPGQFAFADADRVRRILEESGWAGVEVETVDAACAFPEKALIRYFTRLGPVGRVFHEADEHTRAKVVETVRAAFDPFVHGAEVRFSAACWMVSARASSAAPARMEAADV